MEVASQFGVIEITIQACFRKTKLTTEDAYEKALRSRKFKIVPPAGTVKFLMLFSKQEPSSKIQIMGQGKVNVWCDYDQLSEVKDFLNKTLGDSLNPKPFKEPYRILQKEGELRKILENPLGWIMIFAHNHPSAFVSVLDEVMKSIDSWTQWARKD